jgi:hypothetical protein
MRLSGISLSVLILTFTGAIRAQSLSHQVLVPVAGVINDSRVSYSQTGGETAVELVGCTFYQVTQGFQQPLVKISNETPPPGTGMKVYPNPATQFITIELFGAEARCFRIEFINSAGVIVDSYEQEFMAGFWFKEPYNIEHLKNGFYLVRVTSNDNKISRSFKIEKL